ncbi:MAG: hypothetical protein AABW59_00765 [archaeon]|mgnify:CR=1 FL=1
MSIYGGLPDFKLPDLPIPENIQDKLPIILIVLAVIITMVVAAFIILPNAGGVLNPSIGINWKNNPLDLRESSSGSAELTITLRNNTETKNDLTLDVSTESEELIVFCPYTFFTNVEPNDTRAVTCVIRRDPKSNIFAGTYTLTVSSNLGSTKTSLEVKTK